MSLAIAFKGGEGIVLAADSRVTLTATKQTGEQTEVTHTYYDNATKLFRVNGHDYVGAVSYGSGVIQGQNSHRTIHSYLPEFESQLANRNEKRLAVDQFASRLGKFFLRKWEEAQMPAENQSLVFLVGGYDKNIPYGKLYEISIPASPDPIEFYANPGEFGLRYGGQTDIAARLLNGFPVNLPASAQEVLGFDNDKRVALEQGLRERSALGIPYEMLPLQDSVDLSILLIRTTIEFLNLTMGLRGVGGPIDVATITPVEGFNFVQHKIVKAKQPNF